MKAAAETQHCSALQGLGHPAALQQGPGRDPALHCSTLKILELVILPTFSPEMEVKLKVKMTIYAAVNVPGFVSLCHNSNTPVLQPDMWAMFDDDQNGKYGMGD